MGAKRALARFVFATGLHISELILQGAVLVAVILLFQQPHMFPMAIMFLIWAIVFMSQTAHAWWEFESDSSTESAQGSCNVRLAIRAVFAGLIGGIHLKHMRMVYQNQRDTFPAALSEALLPVHATPGTQDQEVQQQQQHLRPTYLHGKTSYSVLAAFPFAIFSLYNLCVLEVCAVKDFHVDSNNIWLYRGVFACSGCASMLSIAASTVDVDYCVSEWVYEKVDSSVAYAWLHLKRRFLEVASRLILLVLASVQLLEWLDNPVLGPLCLLIPVIVFWVSNTIILRLANPAGAPEDTWLWHMCIGLVALVVVPSTFVDSPGYRDAARRATLGLWLTKGSFLVVLLGAAIVPNWPFDFHSCLANRNFWPWFQPPNSRSCLRERNSCLLQVVVVLLIMYLLVTAICRTCFGKRKKKYDNSALRVKPNSNSRHVSFCEAASGEVNLSSFLLQVAAGRSDCSFGEFEDLVIESPLGTGAYGTVVKVRCPYRNSSKKYALKLQKKDDLKEATLLASITNPHPFLVRLLVFFNVPKDQDIVYENNDEDGQTKVGKGFRTGILMELCEEGTLDELLRKYWLHHDDAVKLDQDELMDHVDRLPLWRRLGAELVDVFKFLHGLDPPVVYRDLKPDNVLLRKGKDKKTEHICLTDFGESKRPTFVDPLKTKVGNLMFMAPEVKIVVESITKYEPKYTPSVDVWAVGQLLLIMMWCAYIEYGGLQIPKIPERELWFRNVVGDPDPHPDPRVPLLAVELTDALTKNDPLQRMTMNDAAQTEFFTTSFRHMDKDFEPVRIEELVDDAQR